MKKGLHLLGEFSGEDFKRINSQNSDLKKERPEFPGLSV